MKILSNFYDNKELAASFFKTQLAVYPYLDLSWANENNLLQSKVTPYALFDDGGQAVSILNASRMKLHVNGKDLNAVQIGTVATLPGERGKGYAGVLQRHVLDHFEPVADFMFLFANPSVIEFYPKFGFQSFSQSVYEYRPVHSGEQKFIPLALNDEGIKIVKKLLPNRVPLSGIIDTRDSEWLAEFYCRTFFSKNLWIDESKETIIVASIDGSKMDLHDVISLRPQPNFFLNFSLGNIETVHLGFTPDQFEGSFQSKPLPIEEQIFVRGDFPTGVGPFKFPTLACT